MTYLLRQEVLLQGPREVEFEERFGVFNGALAGRPGFLPRLLFRSLGHPQKYTITVVWESRAHARAAGTSTEFRAWMAANPQPAFAVETQPARAYELVHGVGRADFIAAGARALTLVDTRVNPPIENVDVFEARTRELFDLREKHDAKVIRQALWRFGGNSWQFLTALFYPSDAEARLTAPNNRAPELDAFRRHMNEQHPNLAQNQGEIYEIVAWS